MGNDVTLWRAAIGRFYNKGQCIAGRATFCTYPLKGIYSDIMHKLHQILYIIKYFVLKFECNGTKIHLTFLITLSCCHLLIVNKERHYHNSSFERCNFIDGQLNMPHFYQLLLLAGDIELNPGPTNDSGGCLSIMHQNIRSIRNKMDYIKDNFLDFDILCFTETHLSVDIW